MRARRKPLSNDPQARTARMNSRNGYRRASAAHLDDACGDILAFTASTARYDGCYR
jgi:hypothetical protein